LEQADITSLLLRGKTTNELISSEGGTTFSPENALAQFAASSVQDNMRAATGLDIFEMGFDDPDSAGGWAVSTSPWVKSSPIVSP